MDLIDMKLPKKTKEELKNDCCPVSADNQDRWPYGLQVRFEKEQVDKMPSLVSLKVGDRVIIQGEATVTSIRMSERQNGKEDHSVELQIEKVSVAPEKKKKPEEMSMREYRAHRMES